MIEIKAEEELRSIIATGKLDGKNIYMMGSVPNAERIQGVLLAQGLMLSGIYDNNPSKYGSITILGKNVVITHPPEKKMVENLAIVVIVLSIRFGLEMAEQLMEIGFREKENLFILEALTLDKKIKYVELGYNIYTEKLNQYGNYVNIFVFHGPIGDNYLFASFFKSYIDTNKIENPICLGTSATEKIYDLFHLPNYETISREEVVALEFFSMFMGKECTNLKILQIWEFQYHFNRDRIRFDERFNFIDTYRSYVFNLPAKTKPADPLYRGISDKIKEDFRMYGLKPGRTVVLAPYAYSIAISPDRIFWEFLVNRLKNNGWSVCLNIGENEDNFLNIPVVHFTIAESGSYLEVAGAFVGMRSGFCDVTAKAKCKKVLLYPKRYHRIIDYDRHRNDLDFGSVKRMELCDDAVELEFAYRDLEDDDWEWLAKEVASKILRG